MSVAGCWCGLQPPGALSPQVRLFDTADELLSSKDVQAVAVGTPIEERAYWCLRALKCGHTVLCETPISDRLADVRQVASVLCGQGGRLHLVDRSSHGEIGRGLGDVPGQAEPPVFFSLDIQVPRAALAIERQGALLFAATGYLARLQAVLDPPDTIWAETRSLVRRGRREDVATAYLRMMDGCEGSVHVSALGFDWEARLRMYDRQKCTDWSDGPEVGVARAWREAYADLREDCQRSSWAEVLRQSMDGHRMIEWIQCAARARRELTRKEAGR